MESSTAYWMLQKHKQFQPEKKKKPREQNGLEDTRKIQKLHRHMCAPRPHTPSDQTERESLARVYFAIWSLLFVAVYMWRRRLLRSGNVFFSARRIDKYITLCSIRLANVIGLTSYGRCMAAWRQCAQGTQHTSTGHCTWKYVCDINLVLVLPYKRIQYFDWLTLPTVMWSHHYYYECFPFCFATQNAALANCSCNIAGLCRSLLC